MKATESRSGTHRGAGNSKREVFATVTSGRTIPARGRRWLRNLWVELRAWQWVKNLVVLSPLLFSHSLLISTAVVSALSAFALFCLVSSSVYLLNDIWDYEQDRLHPQKRHRPLAAGELQREEVLGIMMALLLCGLGGAVMVGKGLAMILLGYWIINLCYSIWLKHMVILDVFALATGFVLRVAGGAVVIQVGMSDWLFLCTTLLALFLGFSKRRHELVLLGGEAISHRRVLGEYNPHFLDMMIGIVTASMVMSYALYTVSEETVRRFQTRELLFTLPFVLYGILRYLYLVYHKNQGGDPAQTLLTDRPMIINLCLWIFAAAMIVYRR